MLSSLDVPFFLAIAEGGQLTAALSTSGHKQKVSQRANVVRFAPESRHQTRRFAYPLSAMSRRERMQQTNARLCGYSITSSASKSKLSEILMPSVLAVLRLSTSSNLLGRIT